MNEEEWMDFFNRYKVDGRVNHYSYGKKIIQYASIGKDNLPALLLITDKSSLDDFGNFFKDQDLIDQFSIYALVIAVPPLRNTKIISIQAQSEIIFPLTERIHRVHQPLIIVARKYLAAMACKCIADHPGIVQGLVLIDPVLRTEVDKKSWLRTVFEKLFAEKRHKRKPGHHQFKTIFKEQLEKMESVWKKINIPVFYLKSVNDKSSSRPEAAFATKLFMHSPKLEIEFYQTGKSRSEDVKFKEVKNRILRLNKVLDTVRGD